MQSAVVIDGALHTHDPTVSVFDRGYLFGDGAFEVLRVYGRIPFAFDRHWKRLTQSCSTIHIDFCGSAKECRTDADLAIQQLELENAYLRIIVTRGEGVPSIMPGPMKSKRVTIAAPLSCPPSKHYAEGVSARTLSNGHAQPAAGVKSSNYLGNFLATKKVRAQHAHEAILLGPTGEIREGATSNIYVIRNGHIHTPPTSLGILKGITQQALSCFLEKQGLSMIPCLLWPSDLYTADEVWISSSIRELVPIVEIDGNPIGNGVIGSLYESIGPAFQAWIRQRCQDNNGSF